MSIAVMFVAAVAGSPRSGLTPFLPPGGEPLAPFRWLARVAGLGGMDISKLSLLGVIAVALMSVAFLLGAWAAWRKSVSLREVVWFGIGFHLVFVALPLLVSHDVYLYSMYGRILRIHHANPYLVTPGHFPGDPVLPFVSEEWRDLPPPYGPAFLQLAGVVSRLVRSPSGLILAFKAMAGAASVGTMLIVAGVASRRAPARAPFAAVAVGWNPAILVHVVGGGHIDALLGLSIAIALALSLTDSAPAPRRPARMSLSGLGATAALATGALLKVVLALPLLLQLAAVAVRQAPGRRIRVLMQHLAIVCAIGLASVGPFLRSFGFIRALTEVSKQSNAPAASSFFKVMGRLVAGGSGGGSRQVDLVVEAVFFLAILAGLGLLAVHLVRQSPSLSAWETADAWGWQLMILMLAAPLIWPWYAAWVAPLIWLLPTVPRTAALTVSVGLPSFVAVGEGLLAPHLFQMSKAMATTLAAPIFLALLAWLLVELAQRTRAGLPLSMETPISA